MGDNPLPLAAHVDIYYAAGVYMTLLKFTKDPLVKNAPSPRIPRIFLNK